MNTIDTAGEERLHKGETCVIHTRKNGDTVLEIINEGSDKLQFSIEGAEPCINDGDHDIGTNDNISKTGDCGGSTVTIHNKSEATCHVVVA